MDYSCHHIFFPPISWLTQKCNKWAYILPHIVDKVLKRASENSTARLCATLHRAQISVLHRTLYKCQKTKHHVWMYSSEYPAVCLWEDDKGRRRDAADRGEEEENKTEACAKVNKDAERTWEVLARATMSRTAEAGVADRYCSQKNFLSTSSLFPRKHWNIKLSVVYSVKCLCVCVKCRRRDVRHPERPRNIRYRERRFLGHRGGGAGRGRCNLKTAWRKTF